MCHWTRDGVTLALQILQGFLTPVIGAIAIYIAWQQLRTNQQKLVMDRYERRLRIYQDVVSMLHLALSKPEISELIMFSAKTAEAAFLFEPEIPSYIDEIFKRALLLHQAREEYRDFLAPPPPPGYDHKKVVDEMHNQSVWFWEQANTKAKEKFRKYLYIGQ